jgi:tape measure domain-containing protein
MSDELGRLHLYLAAPADKLAADLAYGDKLISRYHELWQRKMANLSFAGIAANLNVELVAAEGMLDRSLRQMQQRATARKIKISIDTSDFDESGLLAKIAKVTGQTIKVKTDLSELHDLNKLLDVKIDHIRETQRVAATTVISPKVDLSGLENLGRELDGVLGRIDQLNRTQSKFSFSSNNSGEAQRLKIDTNNLSRDVAHAVEQGYKSAQPSKFSQTAGKIAGTAAAPFQAIGRGALEGFGKDLTTGLTGGLINSLGSALSGSIGSSNLVGTKIGESIVSGVKSKFNSLSDGGAIKQALKKELDELLAETKAGITESLGQRNIDIAAGSRSELTRQVEARNAAKSAESLNRQRQQVVKQSLRNTEDISSVDSGVKTLNRVETRTQQAFSVQEKKLFDARLSGDKKGEAAASDLISQSQEILAEIEIQRIELNKRKKELEKTRDGLKSKISNLDDRINAVSPIQPATLSQLVNAAAGKKISADKIPEVIVAPNILKQTGASASYSARGNAILVSPELAAQYRSGGINGVSDRGIESSIHEFTHAADFDFGSMAGVRANEIGTPLRDKKYTAAQVAYAAPYVDQYAEKDRAAELSAYAAEYSIAHPLIQKNKEARNLETLSGAIGFGGTKYQKLFDTQLGGVKAGLTNLTDSGAEPETVSILTSKAIQLKEQKQKIVDVIHTATATGGLPGGDTVQKKIAEQLQEMQRLQALVSGFDARNQQERPFGKYPTRQYQKDRLAPQFDPDLDPWDAPRNRRPNSTSQFVSQGIQRTNRIKNREFENLARPVHAELVEPNFTEKAAGLRSAISGGLSVAQQGFSVAKKAFNPIVSFGRDAYNFAEGAESQLLPLFPFGQQIKSIGKNVALPALAYGATSSIPGIGPALHGTLGAGAEGILSMAGGAAQTGLSHAITGAFADLPMIGPAISSALSTAAGSAIEAGIGAMVPILAGKTVIGAASQAAKQIAGRDDKKNSTKALGQSVASKSIAAGQSLITTETFPLNGINGSSDGFALPEGGIDRIKIAAGRISRAYKTIQEHISNSETEKAHFIAQKLEGQTTKLISEARVLEAEVGKATPEGNKLFSLMGNLGTKRKQAQNALRKIELVEEPEINLGSEIADLRQKKATSRKKQFQKFRKSYASEELINNAYFKSLTSDPVEPDLKEAVLNWGKAEKPNIKKEVLNWRPSLPPRQFKSTILPPPPSTHNYKAPVIPDPWSDEIPPDLIEAVLNWRPQSTAQALSRRRVTGPGRYQQRFAAQLAEFEKNSKLPTFGNSVPATHGFALPPLGSYGIDLPDIPNNLGVLFPPVPSSHNPKPLPQAKKAAQRQPLNGALPTQVGAAKSAAENLTIKAANFDVVAQAAEATISNKELLNKVNSGQSLKPATEEAKQLKSGLMGLADAGKYAIGAFAGFHVGQLLVTQFAGAAKEAVQLTGEFEQLEIRLQAATGSLQSGTSRFNALRSEARSLGVSQRGALETGARLSATTLGTELEGAPTDQLTSQVLGIAKSRGLNQQSTNSLSLAISQLVGKPRVSTEELNQLIESGGLPDARSIGARALGLNAQQFTKQLEGNSGIDSKKFVSAFLSQASSDSLLVKDAALDTQQSKLAKLQASYEDLQVTIGQGINPAFKVGLDAASGGIDLLTKGIEIGSTVLIGLALRSIPAVLGGLWAISKASWGAAAGMSGLGAAAGKVGNFALTTAALYALGEGAKFLSDSFKNAGEDLDKETTKIQAAIDSLHGTKITIDLPKTAGEIGGKDWGESFFLGVQRTTTPLIQGLLNSVGLGGIKGVDTKVQQQQERKDSRTKAIEQLPSIRQQAESAISAAGQIGKLDLQAQQIASRRSALFLNNPNDATGIRQLDTESKNLALQRFQAQKNISPTQTLIQQKLNQFKSEDEKLKLLASERQISESDFVSESKRIKAAIEETTRLQEKLNKAIKSPLDDLAQYTRALDVLAAKYEGIAADIQLAENAQKRLRNAELVSGRASQGASDYRASIDEQTSLVDRINKTAAAIGTLKSQLNSIDPKQVDRTLKNYGLNLNKTSVAEFNTLSQSVTDPLDKAVLSKLATIKQQTADLDQFKTQLDESRVTLYKKIRDENKGVIDYYRSLSQSIDTNDLKSQTLLNNLTAAKNRFQRQLAYFGDSIADGFYGAITDLLQSADDKVKAETDRIKGLRQNEINQSNKLYEIDFRKSVLTSPNSPNFTPTTADGSVASPLASLTVDQAIRAKGLPVQRPEASRGDRNHNAFDYEGKPGTPVRAIFGGTARLEENVRWGSRNQYVSRAKVIIETVTPEGEKITTNYFHLGEETIRLFRAGQKKQVRAGEQIGTIGLDGAVGGNTTHVDVKIWLNGARVNDPRRLIKRQTDLAARRTAGSRDQTISPTSSWNPKYAPKGDTLPSPSQIVDPRSMRGLSNSGGTTSTAFEKIYGYGQKPRQRSNIATSSPGELPGSLGYGSISPATLSAALRIIANKETAYPDDRRGYFQREGTGAFSEVEATRGFPASIPDKENVGRYQFNRGDYNEAAAKDKTITNFLPANQDKIAALRMKNRGYGGRDKGYASLLQLQANPTFENFVRWRRDAGADTESLRDGTVPYEGSKTKRNKQGQLINFLRLTGQSDQQLYQMFLQRSGLGSRSENSIDKSLLAYDPSVVNDSAQVGGLLAGSERRGFGDDPGAASVGGGSSFTRSASPTPTGGIGKFGESLQQRQILTIPATTPSSTNSAEQKAEVQRALERYRKRQLEKFQQTPLPTVRKSRPAISSGSRQRGATPVYDDPTPTPDLTKTPDSTAPSGSTGDQQSQAQYQQSLTLLERAAALVKEEKELSDRVVESKYTADLSTSKLGQTRAITNIDEQSYQTGRTVRDRLRQSRKTAEDLILRPTQPEQNEKQTRDLEYSIIDSRLAYGDLTRGIDRAIGKGNAIIAEIQGKGTTASPEEALALAKTKELIVGLTKQREQLTADLAAAEKDYLAAKKSLQFAQALESKDSVNALNAKRATSSIEFLQIYQQRQQELDKTNTPYLNDYAITGQRDIEIAQEKQSLTARIVEREKERRRYQEGDGSKIYSDTELDTQQKPFKDALSGIRTSDQLRADEQKLSVRITNLGTDLGKLEAERGRLASIPADKISPLGKKSLGQYDATITAKNAELLKAQGDVGQINTEREIRNGLQSKIDNIENIRRLNELQAADIAQSAQKVELINSKFTNETRQRKTERLNYQSETKLTGESSQVSLAQAAVDRHKNFGLENFNAEYDIAVKIQQIDYSRQRRALESQKEAITAVGEDADNTRAQIQLLIDNLDKLNNSKLEGLAEAFNPVNNAISATQKEFRSVLGDFALSNGKFNIGKILSAGLLNAGGQLLDSITSGIFGGLYQKQKLGPLDSPESGNWLGTGLGFLGKILGFADGGSPNYDLTQAELEQSNTPFGVAMRLERARTGKRPMTIVVNEDETVWNAAQTREYKNNIRNFDRGGAVGVKSTPLNLSPARTIQFDYEKIAQTKDININISGDASATADPNAMKQMINAFRSIVTEELINHKRQRTGMI